MAEVSKYIACPELLYAIRDVETGMVIWNARGGAYKNLFDVSAKLKKLHKQNPDKVYTLVSWSRLEHEFGVKFRDEE